MGIFDGILNTIKDLSGAPQRAARRAAPRIQQTLRDDSTTKRGNVPSYGKFGDVPSVAVAVDDEVRVTCADWVGAKAEELGQPAKWDAIAIEEADKSWWSRK